MARKTGGVTGAGLATPQPDVYTLGDGRSTGGGSIASPRFSAPRLWLYSTVSASDRAWPALTWVAEREA